MNTTNQITFREARVEDAENFLKLLHKLDCETNFMLYEPEERKETVKDVRRRIEDHIKTSLLLFAEAEGEVVGYLSAERGFANRIKHSAYVIVGILENYGGRGIGKSLFERLDQWAKEKGITRLELTVMTTNKRAVALYEKMGYKIEGIKERSCLVDHQYIDEYYMAKIL